MRIKYFCICCLLVFILFHQSAKGQSENTDKNTQEVSIKQIDWRIENLMKQVRELFEVYDKEDIVRFVELSHPYIYKNEGKANFSDKVRLVLEAKSTAKEHLPSTVEEPNIIYEIDDRLFAVVSYKLNSISKDKKEKFVALGSMIGISEDKGKSWRFVKGVAFDKAFPDVAGMFYIPNPMEKRFVNGIEQ